MICERCRRRFGKIGENYWNARGGMCPICKNSQASVTFIVSV